MTQINATLPTSNAGNTVKPPGGGPVGTIPNNRIVDVDRTYANTHDAIQQSAELFKSVTTHHQELVSALGALSEVSGKSNNLDPDKQARLVAYFSHSLGLAVNAGVVLFSGNSLNPDVMYALVLGIQTLAGLAAVHFNTRG